ncbi:MAG TPA: hypothetical protein VFJ99_05680, partial [Solirubrobacterales bacterium]|nr:hypothetical protein [Solirubrobacterales bacterium]
LPPAAEGAIAALGEPSGRTSELTVVEAKPGLRDYRKRLRGRKPIDPFRSLGGSGESGGGNGASSSSSTSTTTSTSTSTTTSTESSSSGSSGGGAASTPTATSPEEGQGGGNGSGGGNGGGGKTGGGNGQGEGSQTISLYTFAVDVKIVHSSGSKADGDKKAGEPEVRKGVLPTTVLPGQKKQVVTYMGLSPKTRRPLFLVSADVTGVFGEGKCASGTGTCQLIELEKGFPEVFEYGEGGDRYKLEVTDVEFVVTGHS